MQYDPRCFRYLRQYSRAELRLDLDVLFGDGTLWMTAQAALLLPAVWGPPTPHEENRALVRAVEAQTGLKLDLPESSGYRTETHVRDGNYESICDNTRVAVEYPHILVGYLRELHEDVAPELADIEARLDVVGRAGIVVYLEAALWPLHERNNVRLALLEMP